MMTSRHCAVQGPADRTVVRAGHPVVAADHRHQRHRLRRRQRHAAAGPVPDVAVAVPAPELAPVRHLAFEDRPEGVRIDRAGEPERPGDA